MTEQRRMPYTEKCLDNSNNAALTETRFSEDFLIFRMEKKDNKKRQKNIKILKKDFL